jgi:hypothetical protein
MRSPARAAGWLFGFAILALLAGEILRVYWIMPFPGSQHGQTLGLAWAMHRSIWAIRLLAGAAALWAAARLFARPGWGARVAAAAGLAAVAGVAYQANGPMSADVMFRQPETLRFRPARAAGNTPVSGLAPSALVVGIALADAQGRLQARAYPVRFIGYHHQVRDEVAGHPVMVTYCTVCRTARVFSPIVEGRTERFRLVGMDHFNAMFEDATTGSWWRQATGEAVTGRRKGLRLEEIPSRQMTWAAWAAEHADTDVMDPDPLFAASYARMEGFEEGTNQSTLTGRDLASWGRKSWVVGVLAGGAARAFDWNELVRERILSDRVGDRVVIVMLDADETSFRAFEAPGLDLAPSADRARFLDRSTGTAWSSSGIALDGPRAGERLQPLPAYQEFWHSWQSFHPDTTARGR